MGRRNITDFVKGLLLDIKDDILKKQGKEKQGKRTDLLSFNDKKLEVHNTRDIVSQELGWSTGKKAQFDILKREANPELKKKLIKGEVSIGGGYKEHKDVEKKQELEVKKLEYKKRLENNHQSNRFIDIYKTNKKFRIIYADPPWEYRDKQNHADMGGAVKHYDTMNLDALKSLPIRSLATENSILFLWTTSPMIFEAKEIMDAWGFEYKTLAVWIKNKGTGNYFLTYQELLLVATRGNCTPDDKSKIKKSVFELPSVEHSKKPIEFRDYIDSLYIYGDRIELFSRANNNKKWYVWGNEI